MWCIDASPNASTVRSIITFAPSVILLIYFVFKLRGAIQWLRPKQIFRILLICALPLPLMFLITSFITSYIIQFVDYSNPTRLVRQFYSCLSSSEPEQLSYFFVDEKSLEDSKVALQVYDLDNYCAWWQNKRKCTPDTSGYASNVYLQQDDVEKATLEINGVVLFESIRDLSGNTLFIINESGEIPFHHQVVVQKIEDQWYIASIETAPSDLISVVLSFRDAINAGNADAALALFADDAQVIAYGNNSYGKEQIRGWLEGEINQGARIELIDLFASEDWIYWVNGVEGIWGGAATIEMVVRSGKIQTFSIP